MHRRITLLVGLCVIISGAALTTGALVMAEKSDPPRSITARDGMPGANGADLLAYILTTNPYTAWGTWAADRWTDFGGYLASGAPHGATVRIFVNDLALEAVKAAGFDGMLPYGSIIVKENYMGTPDAPGDLAALTVMYKIEGFNADAGDWFWLKAPGDGSAVDAEGAVAGCIGCHAQDGNADYLLRYAFGSQPAAAASEPLPEADGQAVLDYILTTSPYTQWQSWPTTADNPDDFSGFLASGAPHGNTVRIFVNDRALNAIGRDNFDGMLPPGSLVVKENYGGTPDAPGDLAALTVMYKVDGFNPDAGDWFWLKTPGDGSAVDAQGAVEGCINCHGQDGNSDYLLRYNLPMGSAAMMSGLDSGSSLDGNALVEVRCTVCHSRSRIDNAQKDQAGWTATVDRMIGHGAQLNPAERDAVIAYLSGR